MADEENSLGLESIPPKQSPFTTVTSGAAPKTIVLRKPTLRRPGEAPTVPTASPAAGIPTALSQTAPVPQGIAVPHSEVLKKITSRISVSSATAPIPAVTVPPAATPVVAPAEAVAATPLSSAVSAQAAKKMTSRISLDSAMGGQGDTKTTEIPEQPKTIRLKRPTEAPSAAPSVPSFSAVSSAVPAGDTPAGQAEDDGENSPTRRRTIKVKRPGASVSAPKINLDGVEGGGDNLQNLASFTGGAVVSTESKVNPIFVVAALAALLATSLLCWTLASQAFGARGAAGNFSTPKGPVISPPPGLATFD